MSHAAGHLAAQVRRGGQGRGGAGRSLSQGYLALDTVAGNEGITFRRYTVEDLATAVTRVRRSIFKNISLTASEPLAAWRIGAVLHFGGSLAPNIHPVLDAPHLNLRSRPRGVWWRWGGRPGGNQDGGMVSGFLGVGFALVRLLKLCGNTESERKDLRWVALTKTLTQKSSIFPICRFTGDSWDKHTAARHQQKAAANTSCRRSIAFRVFLGQAAAIANRQGTYARQEAWQKLQKGLNSPSTPGSD